MSAPKPTAKPSCLDDFDIDVKPSKTNKPAKHFNLVSLLDTIKREYDFEPESEFDFKLFCRRIDELIAIPIQFMILNGIKPSKSKNAKPAAKSISIHYDKLQEILGSDCKIQLSLSKLKTNKISPTCLNIFIKGNSKVEKFVKTEWKKGKPIVNENSYLNHTMVDIDDKKDVIAQLENEIEKYDIPVPKSESDDDIEVNDDDINMDD